MLSIEALMTEGKATLTRNEFLDSLRASSAPEALLSLVEYLLADKPLVVLGACQYIQFLMSELDLADMYYIDMDSVTRGEMPESWALIGEEDDLDSIEPVESEDPDDYDAVRDKLLQEVSSTDFKIRITDTILSALAQAEEDKAIFGLVDLLIQVGDRLHFDGEVAKGLAKRIRQLAKIVQDQDAALALNEIIPKLSESPFIVPGEADSGKSS